MNIFRKTLVSLLASLILFSCAAPAVFADEADEEELLIEQALEMSADGDMQDVPAEEQADDSEPGDPEATKKNVEEKTDSEFTDHAPADQSAGNSSVNILSGGTMLQDGELFYYSEDGAIRCKCGEEEWTLVYDNARNLNLSGDMLYYTCSGEGIKRVSVSSGESGLVYGCAGIEQLYVYGTVFYYLAGGAVHCLSLGESEPYKVSAPADVKAFIPTQYGFVFLTGDLFERTLWIGCNAAFEGVQSCYTDGEYLVVERDGTWQSELSALFSGDYSLREYSLHQNEIETVELPLEDQLAREADFFESELYLKNEEMIEELSESSDGLLFGLDGANEISLDGASVYTTAQQLAISNGDTNKYNIVRRARQQTEVLWTPLYDRYAWGARTYHAERTVVSESGKETNYFVAGETYQGIPYSQAVAYNSYHPDAGYVGWDLSVSDYVNAVNNSKSKFYSGYSVYNQTAPYYGTDCSGFVSWTWNLPYRQTCSSLVYYSTYIGTNINQLQLGDCLNCTSAHVVLVTDIGYDANGNIISVEITESTPLIMRVTIYGAKLPNKTNPHIRYISSLSTLQSNYLNNGYYIYRRNYSGSVSYTSDPAVPLAEDGWLSVPTLTTETSGDGSKLLVKLTHNSGYSIHYTTDGSTATLSSPVYTSPIELTETTVIHAMVDYSSSSATGSFQLSCEVEVEQTDAPTLSLISGAIKDTTVSSGSVITLRSDNATKIYYTTDGTEPTLSSAVMSSDGLKITEATTIKAFAVGKGTVSSNVVTIQIKIGGFHTIKASGGAGGSISPNGDVMVLDGADQTFTFSANKNYEIKDVTVDGSSIGAKSSYTFKNVTGDHEIAVSYAIDLPFTDVKSTAWYADEVAFAYTQNLFTGTTSTTFSPNSKMSRGMFVTVLGRFAGKRSTLEGFNNYSIGYSNGSSINIRSSASTSGSIVGSLPSEGLFVTVYTTAKDSNSESWYKIKYGSTEGYVKAYSGGKYLINAYNGGFTDIAGQYYNGYTQWAYMNNLISGTSSTTFSPNASISRQDICVILYNYLTKYLGKSVSTGSVSFTDDASISSYAKTAVKAMANIGVVTGYKEGDFRPKNSASRAEVATMFMRFFDYLNN